MDKAIIVFTKNPEAGKVKTRLATSIGNENALKVYLFLLDHTCRLLQKLESSVRVFVYYDQFIDVDDDWSVLHPERRIQKGTDLGERMYNAFSEVLRLGYKKVLIVGTDIYEQTSINIDRAFEKLEEVDVVVNPVEDGGYCLLGLRTCWPGLFLNKKWSHPKVYKELQEELTKNGKSWFELPLINDVDTWEDLLKSGLTLNEILKKQS